jgi:aminoglycoside N3'-acetyltransferase
MLTINCMDLYTKQQSNKAFKHLGLDERTSLVLMHGSIDGIRQLTYIEVVSNLFTSMTFLICPLGNQYDLRSHSFLSITRLGPISVQLALTHCFAS